MPQQWESPYVATDPYNKMDSQQVPPYVSSNGQLSTKAPKTIQVNNARFVVSPYKPGVVTIGKKKVKGMMLPPLIVPVKGNGGGQIVNNYSSNNDDDEFDLWDDWAD